MKKLIKEFEPRLRDVFDHLHKHPEVSWHEYETTKYIHDLVSDYDCKVTTYDDIPGLVVEVGSGVPVIGLRADMDALWQEVDGTLQANHSCGHDAHMTIAIGVFLTIMKSGLPKRGTFRFIFQPAEEKGTGALALVDKGVIDNVDFLYGMHLRPIQELDNSHFSPALKHGATKFIHGKIKGDDAHGARPHLNKNAIQIGADFLQHLNSININPSIPHSVKMTAFHAGSDSANIIPGNATFSIDLRAQTNEVMNELTDKVEQITNMLADYYQVSIELKVEAHVAAAVLNEEATNLMREAISDSVGLEKVKPIIQSPGGEDFHFYSIKQPKIKATMLGIGCDLKPGLHHPKMTFNTEAIPQAVEVLAKALLITVKKYAKSD